MGGMVPTAAKLHICEGTGALKGPEHASGGQERASKTKLLKPWVIFYYSDAFSVT